MGDDVAEPVAPRAAFLHLRRGATLCSRQAGRLETGPGTRRTSGPAHPVRHGGRGRAAKLVAAGRIRGVFRQFLSLLASIP